MMAFLGGTGPEGRGLALRLALAGEAVIIGSRDGDRARETAMGLLKLAPGAAISGDVNAVAAQRGGMAFITTPYEGQRPVLEQVARLGSLGHEAVAPGLRRRAVDVVLGLVASRDRTRRAQHVAREDGLERWRGGVQGALRFR